MNLDAPSCTVAISDTDYQDSISIPIYTHFTEGQYTYYVMRKDGWTIPSLAEDTVLEFTFTGSSEGLTHQASSYAIIGGPDGDFYLNGELATKTSSHTVTDPALTLKFQASKDGGLIDSVFIQVYQQTSTGGWQQIKTISMSETVQDSTWEASYTLPDHGVYKINGFFDVGTKTYQKMSVISGYKTQAAGLV
ncbi:MAG: hypothetical protein GWO08_02955, partial [Gammaproteobacteria bacterium]|nr:hypothetical protein [Gammaproteobacteria bacterium]